MPLAAPRDSKELKVLKMICAHLEGLTPENGYFFNLAGKAFRGKAVFGQETNLPFVSLLEHPNPETGKGGGEEKRVRNTPWKLLLQGFTKDGDSADNPTDPAYWLKAEVELRLSEINATLPHGQGPAFPAIYRLANLVTEFNIGQGVVRPATKDVSPTAFFYLPITVIMATDPCNPFGD